MRTSLNEIRTIEQSLLEQASVEDSLLMEAKMNLNPELAEKIAFQKEAYALVKAYGRRKLRAEIERVEKTLFKEPMHRSFRQKILNLFK